MKESLSSSALRSGDVDDEEELDALDMRRRFRERDMVSMLSAAQRSGTVMSLLVARGTRVDILQAPVRGARLRRCLRVQAGWDVREWGDEEEVLQGGGMLGGL